MTYTWRVMTDDQFRNSGEEPAASQERTGLKPGPIIGLGVLALFLVFIFQNGEDSDIHFLWFDLALPFWVFAVAIFALGIMFGWFARWRQGRDKKAANSAD